MVDFTREKGLDIIDVSVIIPLHNAKDYILECLNSIILQEFNGKLQVSIFDDGSSDNSLQLVNSLTLKFALKNIDVIISSGGVAKGPGYARNRAVMQSSGRYLCFMDSDDIMLDGRIQQQYNYALINEDTLVGSRFVRTPASSTTRYTSWANSLSDQQLYWRAYASHAPTLIMPTWFCSRLIYDKVGGFDEMGTTSPDDLIFFYKHLNDGGKLHLMDEVLMIYRYHINSVSFTISKETIWDIRLKQLENNILCKWDSFTIWNAGKIGKKFFRTCHVKEKVAAFCDVCEKKISKGVYVYEGGVEKEKPRIPIINYKDAKPPFVICVKLDLTDGQFESNLASLSLSEGIDYIHFG